MTITVTGFAPEINDAQMSEIMVLAGVQSSVRSDFDLKPTAVAGTRNVSISVGVGYNGFIRTKSTAPTVISLAPPTAGRWYAIVNRVVWGQPGTTLTIDSISYQARSSQFLAIAHTTTGTTAPTLPPTSLPASFQSTPGVALDALIAWAWVSVSSPDVIVFDVRKLPASNRFEALEQKFLKRHWDRDISVDNKVDLNRLGELFDLGVWPVARHVIINISGTVGYSSTDDVDAGVTFSDFTGSLTRAGVNGDDRVACAKGGKWYGYSIRRFLDIPANTPSSLGMYASVGGSANAFYRLAVEIDVKLPGEY